MINQAIKLTEEHLKTYRQFPSKLAKRYAELLITRWILHGIDNEIDACIIGEDLWQETEDWETPSYMAENIKDIIKINLPFPNLKYDEKKDKKTIREELKRCRKIKKEYSSL